MSYTVIIQARSGSTRLPGKILYNINGRTLLEYGIERIKKSKLIGEIIVATTLSDKDDVIESIAKKSNVKFFRGSEEDVLARYYYAAKKYNAKEIIRITSDCPLIDPDIIDLAIKEYEENKCDILTNVPNDGQKLTYPRGMDVEIFSINTLELAFNAANEKYEREHVTPYIYENCKNIYYMKASKEYSKYRLTLDTCEDLEVILKIIKYFGIDNNQFSLDDIVKFLDNNQEVININKNVKQKAIGE